MSNGRYAILIANDKYDDLHDLRGPQRDVADLKHVLENPEIGAFTNVETHINRSPTDVRKALIDFFERHSRTDFLLVYFSGHGVVDRGDSSLHLAFRKTDPQHPTVEGISARFITGEMDKRKLRRVVLILDCCYSGSFEGWKSDANLDLGQIFNSGYGRIVLTASRATEKAWDADQLEDVKGRSIKHSLFTHYLIEGLETGLGGTSNKETIKETILVDELYTYAYTQVVKTAKPTRQTPRRWSEQQEGAPLVIARNPRFTRLAAVSPRPNDYTPRKSQEVMRPSNKRDERITQPLGVKVTKVKPTVPAPQPPRNHTSQSTIQRLSPWNPLDYVRLLWWLFMNLQKLKVYRIIYGANDEKRVGTWLSSTLIWLPLLIPTLGFGLETLPLIENAYSAITYLIMAFSLLLPWLLTAWLWIKDDNSRQDVVAFGIAISVAISIAALVADGLMGNAVIGIVLSIVIGLVSIITSTIASLVTNHPVGRMVGTAVSGTIASASIIREMAFACNDDIFTCIIPTVLVIGPILFGIVLVTIFLANLLVTFLVSRIEKKMGVGQTSSLMRWAFVALILSYAFLIWFSFLGGGAGVCAISKRKEGRRENKWWNVLYTYIYGTA